MNKALTWSAAVCSPVTRARARSSCSRTKMEALIEAMYIAANADEGTVPAFYWVDQGFGYALSGKLERAQLLKLAEVVYRQL